MRAYLEAVTARPSLSLGRISGIASIVVMILLGAVALSFRSFATEEEGAQRELADSARLHRRLDEVLALIASEQSAERGFVLTSDEAFLMPLDEARVAIPELLAEIDALLLARHQDADVDELRTAVDERHAWAEQVVALAQAGDVASARDRIAGGGGVRRMQAVRAIVTRVGEREDRHVVAVHDRVERARLWVRVTFVSLVLITAVLAALLFYVARVELRHARAMTEQMAANERMFRALAESATDLVRIHTRDGQTEYVSPSAQTLLGYTPDEMKRMPTYTLVAERDRPRVAATMERIFATSEVGEPIRHHLVRKDGAERAYETRIDLVHDERGRVTHFHTIARDVTARAKEEQRLTELATKDTLTGLFNSRAFGEHGSQLLARCDAEGKHALLTFCDVNGLKVINDTLGHDAGDAVIVDAARLLRETARDADLVARVGGDEFVVLGLVRDDAAAMAFSKRLRVAIDRQNADASRPYRVSISSGNAVFVPGRGTTLEALRAEADAAMYRQKKLRRGALVSASGESFVRAPKPTG